MTPPEVEFYSDHKTARGAHQESMEGNEAGSDSAVYRKAEAEEWTHVYQGEGRPRHHLPLWLARLQQAWGISPAKKKAGLLLLGGSGVRGDSAGGPTG